MKGGMKMIKFVVMIIILFPLSVNAESYLCVADNSTGFKYDENSKTWISVPFKTDSKYLVNKSKKLGSWVIKETGGGTFIQCEKGFNDWGFLRCSGMSFNGDFTMNNETLRFQYVYPFGYVVRAYNEDNKEGSITPFMEIGKCSPL